MKKNILKIHWPNNIISDAIEGDSWFVSAIKVDFKIPSGCLRGKCGACEIDVNGETIRPCISNIKSRNNSSLYIEVAHDPYW